MRNDHLRQSVKTKSSSVSRYCQLVDGREYVPHGSKDVDSEALLRLVDVEIQQGTTSTSTRIIDEDINTPRLGNDQVDSSLTGDLVSYVELDLRDGRGEVLEGGEAAGGGVDFATLLLEGEAECGAMGEASAPGVGDLELRSE